MEKIYICIEFIIFFVDSLFIVFNVYMKKILKLYFNIFVNVVYDGLYFNYGNVYNFCNGIFIVLFDGLYIFIWMSYINFGKIFDVEFFVNGWRKGLGNCNNELNLGFGNCVNIVFVILKIGDKVNF